VCSKESQNMYTNMQQEISKYERGKYAIEHPLKGQVHPITCHEGTDGVWRHSSTVSLISALDMGGWSTPRPGRFTPGKQIQYPLYRRLCEPLDRSRQMWKISPTPTFDPRAVQPVASRYTHYAIPAHNMVH
jgi:hypothetical protein